MDMLLIQIILCFGIAALYTVIGYAVINVLLTHESWTDLERCICWVFWPIFPIMFVLLGIALVLAAMLLGLFLLFVIVYDTIRARINKIRNK